MRRKPGDLAGWPGDDAGGIVFQDALQIIVATDHDNQSEVIAPARLRGSHQRQASGEAQADDGRRVARTPPDKMRTLADCLDGFRCNPVIGQVVQLGRDCQQSVGRKRGGEGDQTRFLDAEVMHSVQHDNRGDLVVSDRIVEAGHDWRGARNRPHLRAHRIGAKSREVVRKPAFARRAL